MVDLCIGLDEIYEALDRMDKSTICNWLKDDGYLKDKNLVKFNVEFNESDTFHDETWRLDLEKLLANRSLLSVEEEQTIKNIAKRF